MVSKKDVRDLMICLESWINDKIADGTADSSDSQTGMNTWQSEQNLQEKLEEILCEKEG